MPSLCQNIKTSYEHLQNVTLEFTAKYDAVKESGDLREVKMLRKNLEIVREALFEQIAFFIVPNATNPYHKALLEAGLELTKTAERQETRLDLRKEITRQLSVYRETKDEKGRPALEGWVKDIQENEGLIYSEVAKDRAKIVERIKEGMVPVVMPGRGVQEQSWEDALMFLQPTWMEDGKIEVYNERGNSHFYGYKNDKTKKMTKEGFFKNIPDRPYLVWVQPTQGPAPATMNKSFDDQQAYYATLVAGHPNLYDSTDLIPTEYVALQAMATSQIRERYMELQGGTKEPTTIKPLDHDASYTRFLSAGPFSDRGVPSAYFFPGDRRVYVVGSGYAGANGRSGFRPASRS